MPSGRTLLDPRWPVGLLGLALALAAAGCGLSRPSPISAGGPYLQVSSAQVAFEYGAFGSAPLAPKRVDVGIANGGAAQPAGAPTATVQFHTGEAWLTGTVQATSSGYALTLAPAGMELFEAGTYSATVQVAWAGASNSPVAVEVQLVVHPHPGMWEAGPPSATSPRYLHTTTALPDGGALVIGGKLAESSIERLDAGTGVWSAAGALLHGRQEHTATLLESGEVLVVGGRNESSTLDPPEGTWEVYDPGTGGITASGSLSHDRYAHAAVLLGDGRVLVVGGRSAGGAATRSCELFDPWTRAWTAVGALPGDASGSTAAVLLADGRVLATGRTAADTEDGAALYDPSTQRWTATEPRLHPRLEHALVALEDGRALVVGGLAPDGASSLTTAELYDPSSGRWSEAGALRLAHDYVRDAAVRLPGGEVLVAGGLTGAALAYTSVVERYDPVAGTWSLPGTLGAPRGFHTVTLLGDGRVMSVGGWPDGTHRPEFWREP